MRNLITLQETRNSIPLSDNSSITTFVHDNDNNKVYYCTNKNVLICDDDETPFVFDLASVGLPEASAVIGMSYITDLSGLCIAANTGDLIVFVINNKFAECVGLVESGILCMSWSPDYEIMILATGKGTLLSMTKDWEVITEVPINPPKPGGKTDENSNEVISKVSISWRGDGNFFCCVTEDNEGKNTLRVFERSCAIHSLGEATPNLSNCTSWRPSGSLIAASQKLPEKHEIVFFERNGLRHGEFSVSYPNSTIHKLLWNSDSDLLAIICTVDGRNTGNNVLQIWHSSNYHWFLKKEIWYDCEKEGKFCDAIWDSVDPFTLRVVTNDGTFYKYLLAWQYTVSQGYNHDQNNNNQALAIVVDGSKLNFTPFRYCAIPPPMCASSVSLPFPPSNITFSPQNDNFIVLTIDNTISIFGNSNNKNNNNNNNNNNGSSSSSRTPPSFLNAPDLIAQFHNDSKTDKFEVDFSSLRHLLWIDDSSFFAVEISSDGINQDNILKIQYTISGKDLQISNVNRIQTPHSILQLFSNVFTNDVFFENLTGSVFSISNVNKPLFSFPTPCHWISVTRWKEETVFIGLSNKNKLYVGNNLITVDCNSFALHNRFLVYTTLSHTIKFLPLSKPIPSLSQNLNGESSSNQKTLVKVYDDSIREVERGSRIVTVVSNDIKVILQIARGNLEVIYPRALTLSRIHTLLSQFQYYEAVILMRKHRIDLNLVYDHSPKGFLTHISDFVTQVSNVEYLNLFISSLRDEDVTKTLFVDMERNEEISESESSQAQVNGKVNLICDKLRAELNRVSPQKFSTSILITYVKKNPPELREALLLIQNLHTLEQGVSVDDDDDTERISAQEALDYIVFLVDVDRLYDVALGIYDFDLVQLVAAKSQKDPKEYMGFLSNLQQMEPFFMRYTIDSHLKNWVSALRNISQAGSEHFPTVLDLTRKHDLHLLALELYKDQPEQLKSIRELYGDWLLEHSRLEEAGYIYLQAEKYNKSFNAFKDSADWRMALNLASKMNYTKEALLDLSSELAETLRNLSRYEETATLLAEHCHHYEQAILSLIDGQSWNEALRLCLIHDKNELVETKIHPAVLEAANSVLVDFEDRREKFIRYTTRLSIVRSNKIQFAQLSSSSEKKEVNDETSSEMSGMSAVSGSSDFSSFSAYSAYSASTSATGVSFTTLSTTKGKLKKNKEKKGKREKNKHRVSGKEGGKYEEEHLVGVLKALFPSRKHQLAIGNLIRALVYFGHSSIAEKLSNTLSEYLSLIDSKLETITISANAVTLENKGNNKSGNNDNNNNNNNNNNNTNTTTITNTSVTREFASWEFKVFK